MFKRLVICAIPYPIKQTFTTTDIYGPFVNNRIDYYIRFIVGRANEA